MAYMGDEGRLDSEFYVSPGADYQQIKMNYEGVQSLEINSDGSSHDSGLGNDGLLIKLDGATGDVIYSVLFGGSKLDYFNDMVLDSDDIIAGGKGTDIINGDQGNDSYLREFFSDIIIPKSTNTAEAFIIKKNTGANAGENALLIKDTGGLDIISFKTSEYCIKLDFTIGTDLQTIDELGNQLILEGNFEVIIGTEYDDEFTVSPLPDTARFVDGGRGI